MIDTEPNFHVTMMALSAFLKCFQCLRTLKRSSITRANTNKSDKRRDTS